MGRRSIRKGFTLIELLVVIAIIAVLIALLVPAVQKVRTAAARGAVGKQSQAAGAACHAYHNDFGYLPYNGAGNVANVADNTSGSWAYQVLPYIEQLNIYTAQNGTLPNNWTTGLSTFMCPLRPRPGYINGAQGGGAVTIPVGAQFTLTPVPAGTTDFGEATGTDAAGMSWFVEWDFSGGGGFVEWDGEVLNNGNIQWTIGNWNWIFSGANIGFTFQNTSDVPLSVSINSGNNGTIGAGGAGGGGGPTTDYGINPYLNMATGAVNGVNLNCRLSNLTQADGTSNIVLLGHIYFSTTEYMATTSNGSTLMPIFSPGSLGTSRSSNGSTPATWLQDGPAASSNQWGSPMPEGGLMAMADGSVHMITYSTSLAQYLIPNSGVVQGLPE